MIFHFAIVAAICFFVIVAVSVLIIWLHGNVSHMNEVEFINFFVNRIIMVDTALFSLALFIIVLIQYRQLISYLSGVSASISAIGSNAEQIEFPSILRELQDSIRVVNENIQHKEITARKAEQRKNDLVVYLAHDLKTPIASIIGYLILLRDEKQLSSELRDRYVNTVLSSSERLDDLINEFFEITRFNLSHITLEYSKIDLTRLLQQLTFEFRPLLAKKNLTCTLDVPNKMELRCDRDKIERVFDNLLRNAVSYSFSGTEVHISAKVRDKNTHLTVTNRGNTIPKDKLERIFEQFFRLDVARSSKTGGSGLGLAIAKQLIELHRGEISAKSENELISFTVTIPFDKTSS